MPNSCNIQWNLLKKLEDVYLSGKLREFYDLLKVRYYMLKQGESSKLLPDVSEYIVDKLDLCFTPTHRATTSNKREDSHEYPSKLDYSDIVKCVTDSGHKSSWTARYYKRLLQTNKDASFARSILDKVSEKDLPGVVNTIILSLSKFDKERLATAPLYLSLLSFPTLKTLRSELLKTYKFDPLTRSDFVREYLKGFGDAELKDESDPRDLERAEGVCRKRIEFLKGNKLAGLANELKSLLMLQNKRNVYDKELYLDYLKERSADFDWDKSKRSYCISLSPFDRQFLLHLFPDASPDEFYRYFYESDVTRLYTDCVLLSGRPCNHPSVSDEHLQSLKDETRCRILDENKKYYRVGEEVRISVEVKNVDSLEWKLFEVNTMTYYEKNSSTISEDLDIDGLKPLESDTVTYDYPAIQSHIEVFSFPHIDHRGCFIVDFFAKGMNSRFLVNMGQLHILQREAITGHVLTILDEDGKRLESNVYAVVDNRKYELNKEHEIIIPYLPPSNSAQSSKILLYEEVQPGWMFVKCSTINLLPQQFSLKLLGDVDNEALVKGNESCNVILRVVAQLNDLPFPISFLKNVAITLSLKNVEDVTSEIVIKPTLKDNEDVVIPVRVMESMMEVSAKITAEVAMNDGSLKTLSSQTKLYSSHVSSRSKSITDVPAVLSLFRKTTKTGPEFVLFASDPSGEVLSHRPLEFKLRHVFSDYTYTKTLETDAHGQVYLGSLQDITSLKVDSCSFCLYPDVFDIRKTWEVADTETYQAVIPLVSKNAMDYRLVCNSSMEEMAPLNNCLIQSDGYMVVTNLKSGQYTLYVEGENYCDYRIAINVYHSAKPVSYNNFIVFGSWARRADILPLSLSCKVNDKKLKVHLQGGTPSARVHVLLKSFFDSEMLCNLSMQQNPSYPHIDLNLPSSVIANDRKLSDEYDYIMERKRQNRTLPGTMLPPPSLLLNPIEIDETNTVAKKAEDGKAYGNVMRGAGKHSDEMKMGAVSGASCIAPSQSDSRNTIRTFSQLIANVPLVDGEGEVDVSAYTETGCEVDVIAIDDMYSAESHLFVSESIEDRASSMIRSLKLDESLDPCKHYTEEKHISAVTAEEPLCIDIKSDIQVLSSLEDVWSLLKILLDDKKLQQFSFLLTWDELTQKEKEKLYNRYNSSEMNVFVYFRDRTFFDSFIVPYLRSKIEKSFLDEFLTGGNVTRFLQPMLYQRLNAFERALLCSCVDGEEGAAIERGMANEVEANPISKMKFASIFRTAMSLKTINVVKPEVIEEEQEETLEDELEQMLQDLEEQQQEIKREQPRENKREQRGGLLGKMRKQLGRSAVRESPSYGAQPPMLYGALRSPMRCSSIDMDFVNVGSAIDLGLESMDMDMDMDMDSPIEPAMAPPPPPPPMMKCMALCSGGGYNSDREMYKAAQKEKHYQRIETTKEYQEGYYFESKRMYMSPDIVPVSAFWVDFAHHLRSGVKTPFLSTNFITCTHSVSEVIFCLSVLGIKSKAASFHVQKSGITTDFPLFVFHKILKEVEVTTSPLMVMQKYISNNNPSVRVKGETIERFLETNEFLVGQPYTCKVIISNMSAVQQEVELMYQIPRGSFPLSNMHTMLTTTLTVKPFSTTNFSYMFYFPAVGSYDHYPAHIIDSTKATVLAVASSTFRTLQCVQSLKIVDVTSWKDVALSASDDVVIDYVRSHDLSKIDWSYVSGRLQKKAFFLRLIGELRRMHFYTEEVWKYGLKYGDLPSARDLVGMRLRNNVGLVFSSSMLAVDSAAEDLFQIREYKPYVNNRCFRLGSRMTIPNDKLKTQYEKFLRYMTQKVPSVDDYALMVYYLILQDRVMDALNVFKKYVCTEVEGRFVPKEACTAKVQVDYMTAYFDCFNESMTQAREICPRYESYPVLYWREAFANIASLLKDVDGTLAVDKEGESDPLEPVDTTNLPKNVIQSKRADAMTDPSLEMTAKDHVLTIHYSNLTEMDVNLYELDVELLFSNNPFMSNKSSSIFIRPNFTEHVTLPDAVQLVSTFTYELPEDYRQKNLLVELRSGTLRETCYAFNSRLLVVLSSKTGQLRVYDKQTSRGLSCCYVKVYAKTSNGVEFLKDGFTDICGYFDYFLVSTEVAKKATNLAIFVDKEGYGSCIREVLPPISNSS